LGSLRAQPNVQCAPGVPQGSPSALLEVREPGLESLTDRKLGEKESPRLCNQNRRMFLRMGTLLHTFCERAQLTLAVGLLAGCAANVALVWAFL